MRGTVSGLSLVEIMFAIGLLAILMVLLFNIVPGTLLAMRTSQDRLQAGTVAQAVIEGLRALPADQLQPGAQVLVPVSINGVSYHRTAEIVTQAPAAPPLLRLRATVTWDDGGQTQIVVQETDVTSLKK